MKSENELENELMKLQELAPMPLNESFILGYLAYGISNECFNNVRESIKFIMSSLTEKSITPRNALQLLVIIKYKNFLIDKDKTSKNIRNLIESYVCEIICDADYLKKQFYLQEIPQFKDEKDNLGAQCPICLCSIDMNSLCLLGCMHMYHKECFQGFAKEKIINKNFPILCPSEDCKIQVKNDEIKEFLTKELTQKYQEFIFQNYVDKNMLDTTWCPTPGCKAVFSFDEDLTNYRCPACKSHYCLKCRCHMHTDLSCEQFQKIAHLDEPDRKFMIFVKGAKYKQCPSCKFWVQKNEGCDHMTCRCTYQFCYVCGGKYMECECVGPQQRQDPFHEEEDDVEEDGEEYDDAEEQIAQGPHFVGRLHHILHPREPIQHVLEPPMPFYYPMMIPHGQEDQERHQPENIQIYNSLQLKQEENQQLNKNESYQKFIEAFKQMVIERQQPFVQKKLSYQQKLSEKQREQRQKWELWGKEEEIKRQQKPLDQKKLEQEQLQKYLKEYQIQRQIKQIQFIKNIRIEKVNNKK